MDASIRARCKSLEARIRELEAENQNLRLKLAGREKMEVLGEKKEKKSAEGAQMAPVVPSAHTHGLSLEQVRRYGRQLVLKEIGVEGQSRICKAKVLVVGAGGLGCPACLYIAGAGVKKLGIVDGDNVDSSNLHRQIIYGESTLGMLKAQAARKRCLDLNPSVDCEAICEKFTEKNALKLAKGYDIILDCTDNVKTRYLIAETGEILGIPTVMGAAQRVDGQVCILGDGGPCYRCLYPDPMSRTEARCSDVGVLGIVPGIIGCLQALLCLRWISFDPKTTRGERRKLIVFDAKNLGYHSIPLPGRRPGCPCCDPKERKNLEKKALKSTQNKTSDEGCGCSTGVENLKIARVTPKDYLNIFKSGKDHILVDVREKVQYDICRLPNSVNHAFVKLDENVSELKKHVIRRTRKSSSDSLNVYCLCRRGIYSSLAVERLQKSPGFPKGTKFVDIMGGIEAWARQVDPSFPVY